MVSTAGCLHTVATCTYQTSHSTYQTIYMYICVDLHLRSLASLSNSPQAHFLQHVKKSAAEMQNFTLRWFLTGGELECDESAQK